MPHIAPFMRPVRQLLVFVTLVTSLLLSACDQQALIDKLTPEQEATQAKLLIAHLAAQDFDAVTALADSSIRTPDLRSALEAMAREMPAGEPVGVKTIGARTFSSNEATVYDLSFEYQYPQAWLLAEVVLQRKDGSLTVTGLHVVRRPQSLEQENAFALTGKSALQYATLAAVIALPLFIVGTLVTCIVTPLRKRKWLWLLFIALGFVQFQLNWTTGEWRVNPISFQLLGVGVFKTAPAAPWILSLSIPLGALVFLTRRRALHRRETTSSDAQAAAVAKDVTP